MSFGGQKQRGGRRDYSFKKHGQSESSTLMGNHLMLPSAPVEVWKPSYTGGVTTIRIFPGLNPENPEVFDPYRLENDPDDFGDWLRSYPAVRSMGEPGVTFITHDRADDSIDPQMTPGWLLYRRVQQAIDAGNERPGWAKLLKGGAGRGAQLPRPSEVYMVQCAIFQHKGKQIAPPRGSSPQHKTMIMELGPSAGRAMMEQFNLRNAAWTGSPLDFEHSMVNGDPISLQNGRFVTFYNLAEGDPRQRALGGQRPAFGAGDPRGGFKGGKEEIGYGCFVEPSFGGQSAQLAPFEALVRPKVQLWSDILFFPTLEQQAALLADKFANCPEVICYAWEDHPEWIPEGVRRAAVARMQAAVPANYPAGGYQQQQAPQQGYAAAGGFQAAPGGYQQPQVSPAFGPAPASFGGAQAATSGFVAPAAQASQFGFGGTAVAQPAQPAHQGSIGAGGVVPPASPAIEPVYAPSPLPGQQPQQPAVAAPNPYGFGSPAGPAAPGQAGQPDESLPPWSMPGAGAPQTQQPVNPQALVQAGFDAPPTTPQPSAAVQATLDNARRQAGR